MESRCGCRWGGEEGGHAAKHMMPCTQANHLLPLEIFLFTMILEEHKEVRRLRGIVENLLGNADGTADQ